MILKNKKRVFCTFLLIILLVQNLLAYLQSTTVNIYFDVNSDGNYEMGLSKNGLTIGLGASNSSANLHVDRNAVISQNLTIGTSSLGNSSLHIHGSLGYSVESFSSNGNLSGNSIVFAGSTSSNIFLNLPYAGNVMGRSYMIKKTNENNSLWINSGGNYIDTYSTLNLSSSTDLPMVNVISDGSQWYVTNSIGNLEEIGADNLIGWWKLDETGSETTVIDAMGSDNTGTVSNLGTWGGGRIGGSLHLGTTTYVTVGSATDFANMTAITLSAWVYHNGNVVDKAVIDKFWDGSNRQFQLWLAADSGVLKLKLQLATDIVASAVITDGVVTSGTWHHVVGTWSSADSTMRTYLNGELQNTTTMAGNFIRQNTTVPRIGNSLLSGSNNKHFGTGGGTSYIDDARIYNRALNSDEVYAMYNNGAR